MFYSGCRVVEVKNLKFEHVYHWRLKNNNMTVRVRLQGKQKVRVVPMPPVVRAIIDRMEKMYGRREGFIFPNMSKLAERFRDILIVEGMYVDEEGNHRELGSFRHTRATFELLRERVSREVLAKWMGHTVREQEHTYSKILDAIKHEQMFKVKGGKGR
jgi:integrase